MLLKASISSMRTNNTRIYRVFICIYVLTQYGVIFSVAIDSGSRYEVSYPAGISHFLEKLAFAVSLCKMSAGAYIICFDCMSHVWD